MRSEWKSFFLFSVGALIVEIMWTIAILLFLKPS